MSAKLPSSMLPAKPPVAIAEDDQTLDATSIPTTQDEATQLDKTRDASSSDVEDGEIDGSNTAADQPPLPDEAPPPLPNEAPPDAQDDGWQPVWDENAQTFYFYNNITQQSQWENPRVPDASAAVIAQVADTGPPGAIAQAPAKKVVGGGYDPAIHGDYDPNADYAQVREPQSDVAIYGAAAIDPAAAYAATGAFNRFTGKWQSADINSDKYSDENKSKTQMNAFFDVDAAANSHNGRSLKAERSNKKLTKTELKAFREKRKEKREEKRRAWLRD